MYFNPSQISLANRVFSKAERVITGYYRLVDAEINNLRYDVRTRAFLEDHEVSENAFAHLCRYSYGNKGETVKEDGYFYRICLQDNLILDAVNRAGTFIKLPSLLLYIAAHELVHVIRFEAGEGSIEMPRDEKEAEERRVHAITRRILESKFTPDLKIVMDCFNDRHTISGFCN